MRDADAILQMAETLSDEATGSSNGDGIGYLLGVTREDAENLVRLSTVVILDRLAQDGAVSGSDLLVHALVTGIELGVAAERVGKQAAA